MKKIIVVIISVLVLLMSLPVISFAAISSNLNQPVPSLHTAYLYVGNNSTGKLFMLSSPADLKDLYIQASFDGSKWYLATGSLKDGLASDITVVRYNALTGAYENRYVIDTNSYKNTSIFTANTYTQYISYGIPVLETGTTTLAQVDWLGSDDVELTLIKNLVNNIKTDTENANVYLDSIEDICSAISSTTTTISNRVNTTNTRLNTIINYLQQEIPNIELQLSDIYDNTDTIIFRLNTCITELQTANFWLENIYNILNDNYATTIPSQDNKELNEYNERESQLLQDKSEDIGNALDNAYNSLDQSGIASINTMLNNIIFAVPELTTLIIFCLAAGLVVLLLGRKVS